MFLPANEFKQVIRSTNLVAFDYIILNEKEEVLLGLRKNSPAKGYWFVPGGRIWKNEHLNQALLRILHDETGLTLENVLNSELLGIYEHIYEENFFEESGYSTHYVVIAIQMRLKSDFFYDLKRDEDLKFVPVEILKNDQSVHFFTKNYFSPHPENKLKF